MPANRSRHLGAMREVQGRRSAAAAAAVVAVAVLSFVLVGCRAQPRAIVVEDFEAGALAALKDRAEERARADEFAGAVLVARHGKVLLQDAWGRATARLGPPTRRRPGSASAR